MSIENHVSLIGNLGDDPKTTYTQGGVTVTKIRLATTTRRKDREGNKREITSWHAVTFFGTLGDIACEYLRKGSKISVQGSIRYSESEKDGVKRYYTDIIADQMMMLDSKPADGERQQSRPQQRRPESAPNNREPAPMDDFADDDFAF